MFNESGGINDALKGFESKTQLNRRVSFNKQTGGGGVCLLIGVEVSDGVSWGDSDEWNNY